MGKYSKQVTERICELIRLDTYTIKEICSNVGITTETYFKWKRQNAEFAGALSNAESDRDARFIHEARKSLLKKLTGYEVEEEKTTYVKGPDGPTIRETVITKRYFQPDTVAIIFTLCNKDGWTNKYKDKEDKPETCVLDDIIVGLKKTS
jgi:transposase-like protein